ncbi:HAD family hydrolase [Candidatus Bathyarchaeota archaeon]|nr:HAD family hydrolase [Candidatus Bathyarchaeota archaeon]
MSHSHPQNPAGGAFFPMDPSMLPPLPPFPNPQQIPFPPGLNLFAPPPLPQHQHQDYSQDYSMAPQKQPKRNNNNNINNNNNANANNAKGKKRKNNKKAQNAPNAPLPKAKQQPRGAGNGMVPPPEALPQLDYPAQHALYGQQAPQAQLPHEQQFMGHLQALIHGQQHQQHQQHLQPPADPTMPPGATRGKGKFNPPTGPKAKSKPQPKRASPAAAKRDGDRKAPSQASGGVPNASRAYLSTARLPPFPSTQPRPLLVIIDLNGTLIHRPSRKTNPTNFQARPHASPFLHYVITTFTTMIWSSAKPENVHSVTGRLLAPADRASLLAVWGREAFGFTDKDYNDRVQCYKRLSRAWGDPAVRGSHPMGQAWDQTNTVLIDDSGEKARSEPHNLVQIPEFAGEDCGDDILPQVHTYLNTLSMQGDVSRYIRESPFRPQDKFLLS